MPNGPSTEIGPIAGRGINGHKRVTPETCLSVLILGVLLVMLGILLRVQSTFSPAVEVAMGIHATPSDPSAPPSDAGTLDMALPEALIALGAAETFLSETLSDKINGKAELYLKAGFVRLDAQRFRVTAVPDAWIEASVYEMDGPEAAYSVYSLQRRESGQPLDDLPQAYTTENAVFLHQGPFYLEIVASAVSDKVAELSVDLARRFTDAHPVAETGGPVDQRLFPEAGLLRNSIQLIPANAFGYSALNNVLVATYRISGTELTAFLTHRNSPEEAVRLKREYGEFLTRFGAVPAESPPKIPGAAAYDLMGFFEIIFVTDQYLAGIHEAEDIGIAEKLAFDMHQRISRGVDERGTSK